MNKMLLPILLIIFFFFLARGLSAFEVDIRVTVPSETPENDKIYLSGTFNEWNPADENFSLEKSDGVYQKVIHVQGRIAFKITRGSWDSVEKGMSGEEVRDRVYIIARDREIEIEVFKWRDLMGVPTIPGTCVGDVRILNEVYSPELENKRSIIVYLPPDYEKSGENYPVFYMHDGQNLFNRATGFAGQEWEVDECAEGLIRGGILKPLIIVGIYNLGVERMNEYSPWKDPKYEMGGKGESYVKFICETLKPAIDKKFRTRPDRDHTFIGGSSMGGLISHYALLNRPDVFSAAVVMSPSFHFAGRKIFKYTLDNLPTLATRFYLDVGSCETGDPERDRAFVEQVRDMSEMLKKNAQTRFVVGEGHNHSEMAWKRRMPGALKFLAGK